MRINSNVKSIKIASDRFAKHHYPFQTQYDFEEAIVLMDTAKNTFSVTYLESSSYDDEDDDGTFYQASDTEYFGLEKSTLISIVSFHVGLILPKEKVVWFVKWQRKLSNQWKMNMPILMWVGMVTQKTIQSILYPLISF